MAKFLLDFNETTRVGHWYDYDRSTGMVTITAEQECAPITYWNKQEYNFDHGRAGDQVKVASVPEVIYAEWIATGKDRDAAFIKRWLNDPENRFFRTRPGRV